MKHLLLSLLLSLCVISLHAQVREGQAEFIKKEKGNALTLTLEGQKKNVETVLNKAIKESTGQKSKSMKGFTLFEGVRFTEISSSSLDIYYKVAKASKKDQLNSKVTLFLSAGYNNFLDSSESPDEIASAKRFLEKMIPEVRRYELQLAIEDQTKIVDKSIKEQNKLEGELEDLIQKKEDILNAIEENKQNQENQKQTIENEQVRLADFQAALRNVGRDGTASRTVEDAADAETPVVDEIPDEEPMEEPVEPMDDEPEPEPDTPR